MDGVLLPAPPPVGDAALVEVAADLLEALSAQRALEHLFHDRRRSRIDLERGALLASVLHLDPLVAEGRARREEEAARGGLAHAPDNVLRKIFAVELVDALDDRLHELAGGGVVGVLGDGDDAHAASAQHRLEGDGVLALAREAAELPDEDLAEGRGGFARVLEHLAELGAVGDAPTLGLVDVLANDAVVVALGVLAQRAQLGGDGEVDVLAVAGDARVEGGGGRVGAVGHRFVLLGSRSAVLAAGLPPTGVGRFACYQNKRTPRGQGEYHGALPKEAQTNGPVRAYSPERFSMARGPKTALNSQVKPVSASSPSRAS